MDRIIERCAGLDVHKDSVTACVRVPGAPGGRDQKTQTFGTTTRSLLALRDWLAAWGVTVVGMESTGGYWKPVYALLEDDFEPWLLNAHHLKAVPGRKTDVRDAEWIGQLVEHGLVRASFVPPRDIRELRDLTRYRKALIQERPREVQRRDKVLQDAGIKLSAVAPDVLGVSGRAMLAALVEGTRDPAGLGELAKGQLRKTLPQRREALVGRFRGHHALLVGELLAHIEDLEDAIERLSQEGERRLGPFAREVELLDTIPGIDRRAAEVILAEIGAAMTRFPTARHLASWAGRCPGNDESAGKRRTGRRRKGSKWLAITLTECANSVVRSKRTSRASQYARIKGRRGHKKAIGAVAHSILTIAYHVLQRGRPYAELGPDYLLLRDNAEAYTKRLVRQLERLGHKVTLERLPLSA